MLRDRKFVNVIESGVICRWTYNGETVDIMPDIDSILGFTNKWYRPGYRHRVEIKIEDDLTIYILPTLYYIATKIEAVKGRGGEDLRFSHDFEDLIYVLNNRQDIADLFNKEKNSDLKEYVSSFAKEILLRQNYREEIECMLPYGDYDRETYIRDSQTLLNMRIQYASDLHLEFGANTSFLREHPMNPVGEILILAGDTGYLGDDQLIRHPFWDWASDNFREVIAIPGNHELYRGFDINDLTQEWELQIRSNVRYVYNKLIRLDDSTDLIASTLWLDIPPKNGLLTQLNVSDFHCISNGEKPLDRERFNEEHKKCRDFIENTLHESTADKMLVVTHHVPSFSLMSEEFKDSPINGAFTS